MRHTVNPHIIILFVSLILGKSLCAEQIILNNTPPDKRTSLLHDTKPLPVGDYDENGETPLTRAVIQKNHRDVTYLLNMGAGPNLMNKQQETPLYLAAKLGWNDGVALLIVKGAEVNKKIKGGLESPLYAAVHNRHDSTVQMLLSRGADVNMRNRYGATALHAAMHTSNQVVGALLKSGAIPNLATFSGRTPLITAASLGKLDKTLMLLDAGADPNHPSEIFGSTLHAAILLSNWETAALLITKGANLTQKDSHGRTAMDFAKVLGKGERFSQVIDTADEIATQNRGSEESIAESSMYHERGCPESEYFEAMEGMQRERLTALIKNNKQISTVRCMGFNLLEMAIQFGSVKRVKLVLDILDADQITSIYGYSPLGSSANRGHMNLVEYFVEECACDINKKSPLGCPLHQAINSKDKDLVSFLLEKGADPNCQSAKGRTPIFEAVALGLPDIVDLLIRHGAKLNIKDIKEHTPCHYGKVYGYDATLLNRVCK